MSKHYLKNQSSWQPVEIVAELMAPAYRVKLPSGATRLVFKATVVAAESLPQKKRRANSGFGGFVK